MNKEELLKKYRFNNITPKKGELHPIYHKHLPACWIIENIYGFVESEEISLGKARELVSAVIEDHIKNNQ